MPLREKAKSFDANFNTCSSHCSPHAFGHSLSSADQSLNSASKPTFKPSIESAPSSESAAVPRLRPRALERVLTLDRLMERESRSDRFVSSEQKHIKEMRRRSSIEQSDEVLGWSDLHRLRALSPGSDGMAQGNCSTEDVHLGRIEVE
ncbi:MAG: hypothetical protein SGPRY_012323 [Prymnesium sp.]